MSHMAELAIEIDEMIEQGFSALSIAVKLNIPLNWVESMVNDREDLELQKQYEYMQYAEDAASLDAQYYGEH